MWEDVWSIHLDLLNDILTYDLGKFQLALEFSIGVILLIVTPSIKWMKLHGSGWDSEVRKMTLQNVSAVDSIAIFGHPLP